jgi:segregation and condensation protein B
MPSPGNEPAPPEPLAASSGKAVDITEPDIGPDLGLAAVLEAVLLVVDEPVPESLLAQVAERPRAEVAAELARLSADYARQGRGFALRQVAGGWRFYTNPACAPYVERFVRDGQQSRLTQAALETLAVIAYKQPVSRGRIAAIRGVNVDAVVKTLLTRGLITEVETDPSTGAILYGTTATFLERLGLNSLEDLEPLAPYLPDPYALDLDEG